MNIADCHGHIFPPLDGACGFESPSLHNLYLQYGMSVHGAQPVVRARDRVTVANDQLWDAATPSPGGRIEAGFRAGANGRMTWRHDDEEHYIQFLPPYMNETASPAETIVAQMDHAGIDTMVLQNEHMYGNLADMFADAMARFPGRFIGTAQVEEAFADTDAEIARLEHQVTELGMSGLYVTLNGYMRDGWRRDYNDPSFRPFWDAVRRLRLPVFWVFPGETPWGTFEDEMVRYKRWLEAYGDVANVIVHGWPTFRWLGSDGRIAWPEAVVRIMEEHLVYTEILYPIGRGGREEYPFLKSVDHVREVFDRFGADRLVWGSDMPNVERYCTYRQTYTYLAERCPWLGDAEKSALFGGNLLAMFADRSARG